MPRRRPTPWRAVLWVALALLLVHAPGAVGSQTWNCTAYNNPCDATATCVIEFLVGTRCTCPEGFVCGEGCGQPWEGHTCVPYEPRCGIDIVCGDDYTLFNDGVACNSFDSHGKRYCAVHECCYPSPTPPPTLSPPTPAPATEPPPTLLPTTPLPATPAPPTVVPSSPEPTTTEPTTPTPTEGTGAPQHLTGSAHSESVDVRGGHGSSDLGLVPEEVEASGSSSSTSGSTSGDADAPREVAWGEAYGISESQARTRDTLNAIGASATVAFSASSVDAGVLAIISTLSCGDQVDTLSWVLHPTGASIADSVFVGCVIVNTLIACVFPAVHRGLACVSPLNGKPMGHYLGRVRFPAVPILGTIFFLQGVFFSAANLVWMGRNSLDTTLGIVSLLLCFALLVSLVYVLRTSSQRAEYKPNTVLAGTRVQRFLYGKASWRQAAHDPHYLAKYGLLFSRMKPRFVYWNGVKAAALSLMTLISGFRGRDMTECGHVRLGMGMVVLLYLLATLHCQPFRVPKDYWAEVVVTLVQLGSLTFLTSAYYSQVPGHWLFAEGVKLTGIAASLILLKALVDLVVNIWGWWYKQNHPPAGDVSFATEKSAQEMEQKLETSTSRHDNSTRRGSDDSEKLQQPLIDITTSSPRAPVERRVSVLTAITHEDEVEDSDDGHGGMELLVVSPSGRRHSSPTQRGSSTWDDGGFSKSPRRRHRASIMSDSSHIACLDVTVPSPQLAGRGSPGRGARPMTPLSPAAAARRSSTPQVDPFAKGRSEGRRRSVAQGSHPDLAGGGDNPIEGLQNIIGTPGGVPGARTRRNSTAETVGPARKTDAVRGIMSGARADAAKRRRSSGAAVPELHLSANSVGRPF